MGAKSNSHRKLQSFSGYIFIYSYKKIIKATKHPNGQILFIVTSSSSSQLIPLISGWPILMQVAPYALTPNLIQAFPSSSFGISKVQTSPYGPSKSQINFTRTTQPPMGNGFGSLLETWAQLDLIDTAAQNMFYTNDIPGFVLFLKLPVGFFFLCPQS